MLTREEVESRLQTLMKGAKAVSIGKNVKDYRAKRDLNQRELALLAEVSPSTISDIERDTKMPSLKILLRIAKALRCSVDDLLKEE